MKKIIALLLLTVICFSLVACGNKAEKELVGNWFCEEENNTLVIEEDGTGTFTSDGSTCELTWTYDEASRLIILTLDNGSWTQECTYLEDSDTIYGDGLTFKRVK